MWSRRAGFVVCVLAAFLWASQVPWNRVRRGYNDFMQLYAGATLAGTPDLYSAEANRAIGEHIGFWMTAVRYVRPPFYAGMLKPLAYLPYGYAYLIFQSVCFASLAAFACLAYQRAPPVLWLLPISIPLVAAFVNGQDVVIVLALCAAALWLDEQKRPWLAGACLALCAIKFHLLVWTPLALLIHRRWRMLGAAAAGLTAEWLTSTVMQGWHWPAAYSRVLLDPVIHPTPYLSPAVAGLAEGSVAIECLLGLIVAVVLITACRRDNGFAASFSLAIYAGLLTAPHIYIQDLALLLLVPVFIAGLPRPLLGIYTPLPYFLLLADRPLALATPAALLVCFGILCARQIKSPLNGYNRFGRMHGAESS